MNEHSGSVDNSPAAHLTTIRRLGMPLLFLPPPPPATSSSSLRKAPQYSGAPYLCDDMVDYFDTRGGLCTYLGNNEI
jgi:hypothetical protein